ncbi:MULTISPECIES: ferredoxin--NADP reductase [Rhodomicrobium]|uniref:ferredoxin--NADP reductase n=1 Tax=Rhodomicrobium TaxID=1068 RepID=UPI000B4BB823|nr:MULTISPECIES: ferredoxin--NADP reductase [Rhodomicrobium]
MSNFTQETVLSVRHWTDSLFSFTATRSPSFRFANGQFTMMGLEVDGKPLTRAYSMVSTNYDEKLEFFSIKVPDGPLTSRLQHIREGDRILVSKKPVGTLILDNLTPGRTLYLFSTGTGLAPFMSIIRDPDTFEKFGKVVLVHGCRQVAELAYGETITQALPNDEFLGELIRDNLVYYPTVTREPFHNRGRVTDLVASGQLFTDIGLPGLDVAEDRVMLCGSPQMLDDMRALLGERGFTEGSSGKPAEFVVEKAFVER